MAGELEELKVVTKEAQMVVQMDSPLVGQRAELMAKLKVVM